MALPSSGVIKFSDINIELGLAANTPRKLSDTAVRTLFDVSSGRINLSNGRGKANVFTATINTNQQELNLRTWALANGWNGTTKAIITINTGIYIWSDNTATPALTINGSWPGGIELINNGFIMGKGGKGGIGGSLNTPPIAGGAGGPAISIGLNVNITNNSYIAGGGGGGGCISSGFYGTPGGGGAGGGEGGGTATSYGLPGSVGNSGGTGRGGVNQGDSGGGGGGRILPGSTTISTPSVNLTGTTPGLGGAAGGAGASARPGRGGNGAGSNDVGGNGSNGGAGGGGGWGASGGIAVAGGSVVLAGPGGGGKAVNLNGNTVTWIANGTRWGAIS